MSKRIIALVMALIIGFIFLSGCLENKPPQSDTGITKQTIKIPVGPDGLTTEQRHIIRRLEETNQPGAIYQFYSISSITGDPFISSTVAGKVVSSGKRLNPYTVESTGDWLDGFPLKIGDWSGTTTEVLQDDGSYGESIQYLFWYDVNDIYHQHYPSDGQMIIVSSQPLKAKQAEIDLNLIEN